jgi:peroxiredoxin
MVPLAAEDIMVETPTPPGTPGSKAIPFDLPGTDGRRHTLDSVRGSRGTLVMFICNHCPYVKAVAEKIARDMDELAAHGVGSVAIMSNDTADYPEDSFANMKVFAQRNGFTFPYVIDETQEIARAYGAVCTPDFFGYDAGLKLRYRGRLDSSGKETKPDAVREMFDAMRALATGRAAAAEQNPSIGCSIKWKTPAE